MHKQFRKFGFFVSKNLDEETNRKINDNVIKYLYKNESSAEKSKTKRKIKSADDTNTTSPKLALRKSPHEGKHRSHKKSSDSIRKKHKRKESLPNTFASETEIYFLSPEEIKRHRKKTHKPKEEKLSEKLTESRRKHNDSKHGANDVDVQKKRNQKKQEEIVKTIKELKRKDTIEKDDYKWLTKKEIFNLISNVKDVQNTSDSSNFFKKFFLFDKQDSEQDKPEITPGNGRQKTHRYSDDNANKIFQTFKSSTDSTTKKVEKLAKRHERKKKEESRKEESVDVMYSRESKKHHQKKSKIKDDHDIHKYSEINNTDLVSKNPKKRKPRSTDLETLIFDSLKMIQKETRTQETSTNQFHDRHSESQASSNVANEIKMKNKKKTFSNEQVEVPNVAINVSNPRLKNVNRTNPLRHKLCLVKNTFAVVEITPTNVENDAGLEKRKNLKSFKKYYKYNRNVDRDSEITTSSTHQTFSDSHKLYQDMSEQSFEDPSKNRRKVKKNPYVRKRNLNVETHISSIATDIDEQQAVLAKPSQNNREEDSRYKINKMGIQKSKIPILSNNGKIELGQESPTCTRSHKKTVDAEFTSKTSKERNQAKSLNPPNNAFEHVKDDRITSPRLQSQNSSEMNKETTPISKRHKDKCDTLPEKLSSPRPSKPASVQNNSKEKEIPFKVKDKNVRPLVDSRIDKKDSRMSRSSTMSKQSKISDADKKLVQKKQPIRDFNKPNSIKNRSSSMTPPPTYRKQSFHSSTPSPQRSIKSPSKVSNDASSSIWSRSSKRSYKNSISSKSDIKIERDSKIISRKKYKPVEKSSTKASLSNSTVGDKSLDSSKNGTSFFLTKSYKDNDKLNRWQKRKLYSDSLRKNMNNKNQKSSPIPPQVLEVRYLTISNTTNGIVSASETNFSIQDITETNITSSISAPQSQLNQSHKKVQKTNKEFYEDDLPRPCIELVDCEKFKELFELPNDNALNEILSENYNFLKKDFSYTVHDLDTSSSSSNDDLSIDELSLNDKKVDDWYEFQIANAASLSEISCCHKNSNLTTSRIVDVGSQDQILDSLSAPGSEESGYATIKSRQHSTSFFERPDIKALLDPPVATSLDSYCVEFQIERTSSSTCGLEIHSIESKSLQTTIECSQKSVQIKMSQEEILETINFSSGKNGELVKKEQKSPPVEETKSNERSEQQGKKSIHESKDTDRQKEEMSNRCHETDLTIAKQDFISDLIKEPEPKTEQNDTQLMKNKTNESSEVLQNHKILTEDQNKDNSKKEIIVKRKKRKEKNSQKFKRVWSFLSCFSCVSSD